MSAISMAMPAWLRPHSCSLLEELAAELSEEHRQLYVSYLAQCVLKALPEPPPRAWVALDCASRELMRRGQHPSLPSQAGHRLPPEAGR